MLGVWIVRVALAVWVLSLGTTPASARQIRRFFQPTDLELEDPGIAELDMQMEFVRGSDAYRVAVPDFELDVGILPAVELDVDGAFALEDSPGEPRSLDQSSPDNLWLAGKVSILQIDETEEAWGVGFGLQLGPKLPTAPDTFGVGGEGLALVGLVYGPLQVALNAGALGDPDVHGGHRPIGFEGGVDISRDLDSKGQFALAGSVGAVHFFSDDPDQLSFMAGIVYDPTQWLELSVMGLAGALAGGDRYGVVIGITPKFRLWN